MRLEGYENPMCHEAWLLLFHLDLGETPALRVAGTPISPDAVVGLINMHLLPADRALGSVSRVHPGAVRYKLSAAHQADETLLSPGRPAIFIDGLSAAPGTDNGRFHVRIPFDMPKKRL